MSMGEQEGLPLQNKELPRCSEITPGQKKVAHPALMGKSNIYLPKHIKLGLIKISVTAMDKKAKGLPIYGKNFQNK